MGTEETMQEQVPLLLRMYASIQNQMAGQPSKPARRGRESRVVRLRATRGDDRIGAALDRVCDEKLKLPDLVPAERESRQIVAFDEDAHT
jgi:hypothetical protein